MKDPSHPGPSPSAWSARRIAIGVAGVALASMVGGLWLFRVPLADGALRSTLAQADIEGDFALEDAGLWGARLKGVRIGDRRTPDVLAQTADLRLAWGLLGPHVDTIRLTSPRLRVRVDERGVSFGQLDALRRPGGAAPQLLPPIRFDVTDGAAIVSTPAGDLPLRFEAQGRLTRDFSGRAEIARTSSATGRGAITEASLKLEARTVDGVLQAQLEGGAARIRLAELLTDRFAVTAAAAIPARLSAASLQIQAGASDVAWPGGGLKAPALEASATPASEDRWRARISATAGAAAVGTWGISRPLVSVAALGDARHAAGQWTLHADEAGDGETVAVEPAASGDLTLDAGAKDGIVAAATGQGALPDMTMSARARAQALAVLPPLAGSPLAPQMAAGRAALDRALARFSTSARLRLDWRGGAGRLSVDGPLSVDAREGGGRLVLSPSDTGRPVLQALAPSGALEAAGVLTLEGGDLPPLRATLTKFSLSASNLEAAGDVVLADWRAAGGRIDLPRVSFTIRNTDGAGAMSLDGAFAVSGRTDAIAVDNLRGPLRLDARWGGETRVALRDGCTRLAFAGLDIPGHRFGAREVSVCALEDGLLYGADARGQTHGGFAIDGVSLAGRTADRAARAVSLSASRIEGHFTGARADARMEVLAREPAYVIDFERDRRIRFSGDLVTARTEPKGGLSGVIAGGELEDPALPTTLTDMRARWRTETVRGQNAVVFSDGAAHVTDKPVPVAAGAPAWRPRFNPLNVVGLEARLADERLSGLGGIELENGARPLATFTAEHTLATGAGEAHVVNPALEFSSKLDLFEITELARGVVDHVKGPVGLDFEVAWDASGMRSQGIVRPEAVSLNASALGPVSGISGAIRFNDLFALTTPPGQQLRIAELNPGVIVSDGVITFQMLGPDRVRIETAQWPFAAGKLSVDPQVVTLGADTFRMTLSLREVDVQQLLNQLDFKDLTATGHVEGQFPLVFTPNGGRIEKGELRGDGKGGTISYTGSAGSALTGPSQIAFDALKSFAYDNLVLELEGDLDGDIVTAIHFTGENMQPVGGLVPKGALPIPGVERLKVTGWPFRFTVGVRAPFRRLVKTSDDIRDARPLVDEAIKKQDDTPVIDPAPPPSK